VVKVGQQALPVFLTSIILAQAAGILLDLAGGAPSPSRP
jgi:hypothetical protein